MKSGFINKMKQYLTKVLFDLVSIPSLSGEERNIATFIYNELKKTKIKVKKDSDGNVFAFVGKGKERLIINGHMDTVATVDGWTKDPFKPEITDNKIYGLGTSDMKSGLAVMLYLAKSIKPNIEVLFAFTICEEGSTVNKSNGVGKLLEKYDADYAVTCEPSVLDDKLAISLGCQGRTEAEILVHGKSVHSSQFERGKNAIYEACKIAEKVEKYGNRLKSVNVYKQCSTKPSISVVELKGEGGKTRNVIPGSCKLFIDRRLSPGENLDTFKKEVASFTSNIDCEVKFNYAHTAVMTDLSGKLFNTAVKSYKEIYKDEYFVFTRGRLDLVYFSDKGMDILNIGPGIFNNCHSPDEFCKISDMEKCTVLLKNIIEKL